MHDHPHIDGEKVVQALEQVRKDIAHVQRDLAYAEGNRTIWLYVIMAAVVPHFLSYWLGINIGMGLVLLAIYLFVDRQRIKRRALRSSKEPS